MISVTAAAHGFRRTSRSMGTHLKAYGSGRVALGSIDEETDTFEHSQILVPGQQANNRQSGFISPFDFRRRLLLKFVHILLRFINAICPLISLLVDVNQWSEAPIVTSRRRAKREAQNSVLNRLEDKTVLHILKQCDAQTVLALEATCSRFRRLVCEHNNELAKFQKDQIKLHFDEGEIIVFPMDERQVPARYPMPSIEHLTKRLRHLSTLSLFIRGLIPAETLPVLKRLSRNTLATSQIYFLWCEFDEDSGEALTDLFRSNLESLSDIGFEVCSPAAIIGDDLIEENLSRLVSFRVWHEDSGRMYAISDQTLFRLADLYRVGGGCPLETLDIAAGRITVNGVCALIEAWYEQEQPSNDLYLSLHNCGFTQSDVIQQLYSIPLHQKYGVERGDHRLTLTIT